MHVEGARWPAAGHQVEVFHVGKMKINGCLGCEYCHGKGEGKCIQKDDMEKIMPAYLESDSIFTATGAENKSDAKLAEIKAFAEKL